MRKVHKRYVYIINEIRKLVPDIHFDMILDCASGCADGSKHLVEIGSHVIGIDTNQKLIDEGCLEYSLDLRKGNILSLDITDDSIDFFVSSETLEHIVVKELSKAAAEISRVCKKSSYICITVPSNKKECLKGKYHKSYLGLNDISELFSVHGYSIIHTSVFLKNIKRPRRGNLVVILERS